MNAVAQPQATPTPSTQSEAQRKRSFGRVYDHDKGTLTITSAFDPSYSQVIELSKIPAKVLEGFALQGLGDYIVNEGNEALKDDENGDEAGKRAAALAAIVEAYSEASEGKIDFRTGVGIGGMRSAIGAGGAVLFELGKTFVKNARGEKLAFTDVHSARNALKSLYLDTDEVEVTTPEGKKVKLTGRMIFNAIMQNPQVKEALAAKRKVKKSAVAIDSVLG